jgi:hypothetical protein
MADSRLDRLHRRVILRSLVGLGAVAGTGRHRSFADSNDRRRGSSGRGGGAGHISHIPGALAPSSLIAEWYDSTQIRGNGHRIAATKSAFDQAPDTASRYEKTLRPITWSHSRRSSMCCRDLPSLPHSTIIPASQSPNVPATHYSAFWCVEQSKTVGRSGHPAVFRRAHDS